MSTPKLVLAELLTRVEAVYGKPLHSGQLVDAWHRVLGHYDAGAVTVAVDQYISGDHRFFPKPGQIRKEIEEALRGHPQRTGSLQERYDDWEQGDGMAHGQSCPVCAAVLAEDPTSGRLAVHHDHQRHYEAGIGYSGPRTGPVEQRNGIAGMRPATWQAPATPVPDPIPDQPVFAGLENRGDAFEGDL
jgi:hypothetical protein